MVDDEAKSVLPSAERAMPWLSWTGQLGIISSRAASAGQVQETHALFGNELRALLDADVQALPVV